MTSTQGLHMLAPVLSAVVVAAVIAAQGTAFAQSAGSIVLIDSTGRIAARPLNESLMLVAVSPGITAPASIVPVYGAGGRTASGLATWKSGGSVLFTSSDCTTGAHVHPLPLAGVRAAAQVQTSEGIVLYAGAIGPAATVTVQSILYDAGCSPLTVRQDGLHPVLATLNLSTVHPPPLSFQ